MELHLSWLEDNQPRWFTVTSDRHWERALKVGRDPLRAELVIGDPTVSGLHISIYYDPQQKRFILENLRESNPAIVNGRKLAAGTTPLTDGSKFQLGAVVFKVGIRTTALSSPPQTYGLKCPNPKCGKVCAYDHLKLVCPWCGTSLASAQSVLIQKTNI